MLLTLPTRYALILFCAILSPAMGAVASVAPPPWSWVAAIAALLAAGVAGLVSKVPAFLVGRPLVSPALALAFFTVAGALVDQAMATPEGLGRAGLLSAAVLCSGLAGKPLPTPGAHAGKVLPLLLLALLSARCVPPSSRPAVLNPNPFTFKTDPTIPIERCLDMAERQSKAESYEVGLTAVVGGGAVLASFLAIFLENKVATATSSLTTAAAAGGALYANRRAAGLDKLLATYGCPRPLRDEEGP